jgi:hypothetical protein
MRRGDQSINPTAFHRRKGTWTIGKKKNSVFFSVSGKFTGAGKAPKELI